MYVERAWIPSVRVGALSKVTHSIQRSSKHTHRKEFAHPTTILQHFILNKYVSQALFRFYSFECQRFEDSLSFLFIRAKIFGMPTNPPYH